MKRTLDKASNRKADYASRHPKSKGDELLPDDCPHANEDSKTVTGWEWTDKDLRKARMASKRTQVLHRIRGPSSEAWEDQLVALSYLAFEATGVQVAGYDGCRLGGRQPDRFHHGLGSCSVDRASTTLHIYRFDPSGSLATPGNGERVIVDRQEIARIAAEVNRLPPFPKLGRNCSGTLTTYQLSFDYSNGDSSTVELRPSPCGMVTLHGEKTARADAVGSNLLRDVMTLVGSA